MNNVKYRYGIMCIAYSNKPLKYLLLHRKLHWKGWELPKGGKNGIEKAKKTVKREIKEETGLNAKNIKKLPYKGEFIYSKNAQKYWNKKGFKYTLFSCEIKGKIKMDPIEHDKYKWCTYSEALKLLKWPNQRKWLRIVHKENS